MSLSISTLFGSFNTAQPTVRLRVVCIPHYRNIQPKEEEHKTSLSPLITIRLLVKINLIPLQLS